MPPPPQPPVPSRWYRAPPSPLRTGRGDLPNGAGGLGQHSWRCDGSGSCYGKRPPTRGKPTAQRGRSPHRGPAAPQLPPSLLLCPPAPSPLPAWVLAWGPASPRVPAPQVRLPWPLAQGGKQQQGGGGLAQPAGGQSKAPVLGVPQVSSRAWCSPCRAREPLFIAARSSPGGSLPMRKAVLWGIWQPSGVCLSPTEHNHKNRT